MLIGHVVILDRVIEVLTDNPALPEARWRYYGNAFHVRSDISDQQADLRRCFVEYIFGTYLPADVAKEWILNIFITLLANQHFVPELYPIKTPESETF